MCLLRAIIYIDYLHCLSSNLTISLLKLFGGAPAVLVENDDATEGKLYCYVDGSCKDILQCMKAV